MQNRNILLLFADKSANICLLKLQKILRYNMAKKTRDEIRQELNEYLAAVKEKLAQLDADHNAAKTNLENNRNDYEKLIIQFNNDKVASLANLKSIIEQTEEQKNAFKNQKSQLFENLQKETQEAIEQQTALLQEKTQQTQEDTKKHWFKILSDWSTEKNNEKLEELETFIQTETGKATNIVSQDILSKESNDLAKEKSRKRLYAEIKLTIALVFMLLLSWIMYTSTPKLEPVHLAYKILMFVPFGVYIWLQAKQIRRESCLRDHYHHKQLVMASYSAFFGFLKNNEKFTDEKQVEMTEAMFAEVRDNAANRADNNEAERLKAQNKLLIEIVRQIPSIKKLADYPNLSNLIAPKDKD